MKVFDINRVEFVMFRVSCAFCKYLMVVRVKARVLGKPCQKVGRIF